MNYEEIIKKAREWAVGEIEKYNSPALLLFEISETKALELAEKLNADKNIVHLGAILMDIGLGKAKEEGRVAEHTEVGLEMSEEFLKEFDLDETESNKILNCVAAHHGKVAFESLESEICANADCYRFVSPKGVFAFLHHMGRDEDRDFGEALNFAEEKMDEKWGILSLDICKEELEPHYRKFKELIDKARQM